MSDPRFFLVIGKEDVKDLAEKHRAEFVFRIEYDGDIIVEADRRLKLFASEKKTDFNDLLWNIIRELAVVDGNEGMKIVGNYVIVGLAMYQILADRSVVFQYIWDGLVWNGCATYDLKERQSA